MVDPEGFLRRRRAGMLTSRLVLAATLLLWGALLLGCMSLSFGGRHCHHCTEDGVFCQEGETALKPGQVQQVFYPVPFASPPNLVLDNTLHDLVIREQCADFFRVEMHGDPALPCRVHWKARGLRGGVPAAQPTGALPQPPTLPPPNPLNKIPPYCGPRMDAAPGQGGPP